MNYPCDVKAPYKNNEGRLEKYVVPRKKKTKKRKQSAKWSNVEYNSLIGFVREFGEDWEVISKMIPNKTAKQCMQKFKNS